MVCQVNLKLFCYRIQLKPVEVRKENAGQGYRVEHGRIKLKSLLSCILFNKADVKTGIMSHHDGSPAKLQKFRKNPVYLRRIQNHVVIDTRQLLYLKGNRHVGVDEAAEFINNPSLLHPDCAYLNDPVLKRAEAGRLDIEDHTGMIQGLSRTVFNQFLHIVDQISLHTVKNLEIITSLHGMVGIRKGLDTAVIRYRHRVHSPLFGPLNEVLYLGNAVHIAHLGMAVQFHTLDRSIVHAFRRKILAFFNTHNRTDGQLPVETVDVRHAFQPDKLAGLCRSLQILK